MGTLISWEHLWQVNSEATWLGGYLGLRIFGKGIGASDNCEMGALAGWEEQPRSHSYTVGEAHPSPVSKRFASTGAPRSPTPRH